MPPSPNPSPSTSNPSQTDPPPPKRNPQRAPPPQLFLGPSSINASLSSLAPATPLTTSNPLSAKPLPPANPLSRPRPPRPTDLQSPASLTSPLLTRTPQHSLPTARLQQQQQQDRDPRAPPPPKAEPDRSDAIWAEMQATLAEVEQSASKPRTHFFGPEHSRALDELRAAQIGLAKAWARGEAEDVADAGAEKREREGKGGKGPEGDKGRDGEEEEGGKGGDEDILSARKRREANDRYFRRVQAGVLDVVGRLEEVAVAMGKVGRESREIWSGSESLETGSLASS